MRQQHLFDNLRLDLPASIVVFLVATPLCLGIALASGAPLFSGIIAGVVGGIVVGLASGSALGVSGPAAGLAVIVLQAIATLGTWQAFLLAVVIAGMLQVAFGLVRAGVIAYYFPSSVIKGMLAGIGLTIILKQVPHAIGYDAEPEGMLAFSEANAETTFSAMSAMLAYVHPGAVLVTLLSLVLLLTWDRPAIKHLPVSRWVQGPLVAVMAGIAANVMLSRLWPAFAIQSTHLVQLPVAGSWGEAVGLFTTPDFSQWTNPTVYTVALTIAVVASLETLLCVEATDRLDPLKRTTSTDRELKAQGIGNIVSGLIGGLPVTQVIVRSSANIQSGARTKLSAIAHGVLLLVAVLAIPRLLNLIPLATLAAILFTVGYKLARPALFADMYRLGWHQFAPFAVTVAGILLTDLLVGIGLGLVVAVFFILLTNYRHPYFVLDRRYRTGDLIRIQLSEDVSFLNRASIMRSLASIPEGARVEIDASRTVHMDHDVYEIIRDFEQRARMDGIALQVTGLPVPPKPDDAIRRLNRTVRRLRSRASQQGDALVSTGADDRERDSVFRRGTA